MAKISLIDICIFEREGGYDSLSNARDVIQQFNPKHDMISSANSYNFWFYYTSFFLIPKTPAPEIMRISATVKPWSERPENVQLQ